MTMDAMEIAGLDGGTVRVPAEALATLADRLEGQVLRPGDVGWDDARLIWNAMVGRDPALFVRPASVADVTLAVRFASDQGLLLGIKGGGHNIAGLSMAPGGLTLDMSLMRDVEVDPAAGLVHAGPGCLLKDVDAKTQAHGLAAVLGFVSETGLAGLTVGGGFGYLTRRFGWTVDTLEEVEIVTADGEIRIASRAVNPDLFWALRGGGGNFGVVTGFTFRLYEVGPEITGGLIAWSADRADDVLATYRALTESAPRELTAAFTIRLAPPAPFLPTEWHGKPIAGMVVCHTGTDPQNDLAPLRALGQPIVDLITEKPYVAQQSMLDATQPKGRHYYWKSEFVPGLPDGFMGGFRDAALRVTSPMSQSVIFHLAGALNEIGEDEGAVGNRNAAYISAFTGSWAPDDDRADEHLAWARDSWAATLKPFSTGGNYVNFQVFDDDAGRTAAAYGGNYDRLHRVKAAYDPQNLFRVNRNVPPAN